MAKACRGTDVSVTVVEFVYVGGVRSSYPGSRSI